MKLASSRSPARSARWLMALVCLAGACKGAASEDPPSIVLTHVTVLPMTDDGKAMADQTVVVRDGVIIEIGNTDAVPVPSNAVVIAGEGGFVIPGLIDMHVHFVDPGELDLFVTHGVTTVRNMGDFPDVDVVANSWAAHTYYDSTTDVRAQVLAGDRLGPDMYLAGRLLDGPEATLPGGSLPLLDADAAEAAVLADHAHGYDLIKVYDNLPAESFERVVDVASELGMPVVGHAPLSVSYAEILDSGLHSNEHLTMFRDPEEIFPIMDSIGAMTAASGIWNCPTLVGLSHAVAPDNPAFQTYFSEPGWDYLAPETKAFVEDYLSTAYYEVYPGDFMDTYFVPITSALVEADAPIVVGTDAPVAALPGIGMHQELQWLVDAGMTPDRVLRAATRDAATALGRADTFGTVEVGMRADLVLLHADPRQNIANTTAIDGVMLRGEWLPRADLDAVLAKLATD